MATAKAAVVLAAGQGKRMNSDLPKVLHTMNGKSLIGILLDTLKKVGFEKILVVVGFKGEMVEKAVADYPVEVVWQTEQLGTGHAVMMAQDKLADFDGVTLVALGDVPFLSESSIRLLFDKFHETNAAATCLSAILDDPTGYGRIIREGDSDILQKIVEHRDASEEIKKIGEINTGTFCFDNQELFKTLKQVKNDNDQSEYYLTDTIKIMRDNELSVSVVAVDDPDEVRGVNSMEQLDYLAEKFAERIK